MKLFKPFAVKSLALVLALSVAPAAVPTNTPLLGISQAQAGHYAGAPYGGGPFGTTRYYRGDRYYGHRRDFRRHRGFRHYRGYRRHRGIGSGGAAILGGIIGFGLGAAIASQPRYYAPAPRYYRTAPRYYGRYRPFTRAWYRYCAAKYRSFDPRSGTFQPYHGPRRLCR